MPHCKAYVSNYWMMSKSWAIRSGSHRITSILILNLRASVALNLLSSVNSSWESVGGLCECVWASCWRLCLLSEQCLLNDNCSALKDAKSTSDYFPRAAIPPVSQIQINKENEERVTWRAVPSSSVLSPTAEAVSTAAVTLVNIRWYMSFLSESFSSDSFFFKD